MSVSVERTLSTKDRSRRCVACLWRLVPHVLLSLSLVAYAAFGAFLFQHIEGGDSASIPEDYRVFLDQIVDTVQNFNGEWDRQNLLSCLASSL